MMPQSPFIDLKAGPRRDCLIEVDACRDFERMLEPKALDMASRKVGLDALEQIMKTGRPAVIVFLPAGMKWEASSRETMMQNLARLSQMKPIILVAQGGK